MMRRGWTARAVTVIVLLAAADASAQVSGSVAVVSDYLFRGVSLSEGRPAAQVNLNYDDESGWYAGAFASSVRFAVDADGNAEFIAYAGHAQRLGSGLSLDIGVSYAAFPQFTAYNYAELHAALATSDVVVQLSYSPDYFGREVPTVYLELNANLSRIAGLAPFAHVGVLRTLSANSAYGPRTHFDGRVGVGYDIGRLALQLSWGSSDRVTTVDSQQIEQDKKPVWVFRLACWF
jgi:uncharacterized protein (TIGR02001 family)